MKDSLKTKQDEMSSCFDADISEYVVISEEEALRKEFGCLSTEIERITDTETLQARLQDEVQRNKRFLSKMKDLSKKYRKALKKIEFQDLLINEMANALRDEKENSRNSLLNDDFAHVVYGSLKIEECEEHNL
eukprot:gene16631-18321_t